MPNGATLLMTPPVYQSILQWSELADRPEWQRDCLRRIVMGELLTEAVLDELEAICCGSPTHTAIPLEKKHLPCYSAGGDSVALLSIADLSNVNRLPSEGITFGDGPGISVIYGENGSGKSGYARIIKTACHTRGSKPTILGNVNAPPSPLKPSAKIQYSVKDVPSCSTWKDGQAADKILSSVFVFDSESAKHYLNENGPTCFTPLGLHVLVELAQVADKLNTRLQGKHSKLEEQNRLINQGWKYPPETKVAKLLQSLSHSTTTEEVEKLASFGDDKASRLQSLTQALSEDPLAKSRATNASANRIRGFMTTLQNQSVALNDVKVEELNQSLCSLNAKAELMKVVNPNSFDNTFLPGTGNELWQELWHVAKKFAVDFAYQGQEYPSTTKQACVLCQRPLNNVAILERMQRFDTFVLNQAASQYHSALESWKAISSSFITLSPSNSFLKPIEADILNLSTEVRAELDAFLKSMDDRIEAIRSLIKAEQWSAPTPLATYPQDGLDAFISSLDQHAELEASLVMPEEVLKRKAEKAELEASMWLNAHKTEVLEQVVRLRFIHTLNKLTKSTTTHAISKKNGEIANEAITDTFIKSFEAEAQALQITTITAKIEKIGARKGTLEYGIKLDSTIRATVKDVASEGEQRAISLAAFFAELQMTPHKSTLVIDDPVSSLDYHRRRHVARRLIQEANHRQVIVFTHDTMFLMELLFQAKEHSIQIHRRHLHWENKQPGKCATDFPWEAKGYKAQLTELEQKCRKLRSQWNPQPNPSNCQEIQNLYTFFRGTLELIAQDVVVAQVVHRLKHEVEISNLKNLESPVLNKVYT